MHDGSNVICQMTMACNDNHLAPMAMTTLLTGIASDYPLAGMPSICECTLILILGLLLRARTLFSAFRGPAYTATRSSVIA
jgi:hypothetical protein